ncbi:MAG TPA: exodeoxyribonuclease VII large subunit [Burkholderiales bacterium]|nr:exodeoxyribonuclease VII large subunit [Burkholderiales bacterium]
MPGEQGLAPISRPPGPQILTVSALIRSVRDLLEHRYPLLWVAGEISNLTLAKSGHAYFVLKDEQAQARCVMFRSRYQSLDWEPREGTQIEAQVLVSLYEARGEFQLNVETMRRAGLGARFEAFVKLRDRLDREGLFDAAAKRPLPAFPRAIGVITSRDAAALRDVLTTLKRRNPSIAVILYPVPVQGSRAAEEIAAALARAGRRRECEVVLLVRGGGSIEDLWTFNEEIVARAVRACPIPVVTGIGHETDFTIADFAADRRAPTPTAAAELVSPERERLRETIALLARKMHACARRELEQRMLHVDQLARRLIHPGTRLAAQGELLAQLRLRLASAAARLLSDRRWQISELLQRGRAHLPRVDELTTQSAHLLARLRAAARSGLERTAARCASLGANLSHLDPAKVLERGYSIVEKSDGRVVRDSTALVLGEAVVLRLARGSAGARIETTNRPAEPGKR